MIEVTWKFTKRYSEEEFKRQVSESNDVTYLGYLEIEHDLALADGSDDFNLTFEIETK